MPHASQKTFVAFFRNLNLGRTNCPTRQQFETAFVDAGAATAISFLTNGTIAFQAKGIGEARKILAQARVALTDICGLTEPAFLRSLVDLRKLVDREPFVAIDRSTVHECCITFLHDDAVVNDDLPSASRRGDVEIIATTRAEIFSVSRKLTLSPGSPNAFLEKALRLPATTRAWNTIVRLVAKYR